MVTIEEKILDLEDTWVSPIRELITKGFNEQKSEKAIADYVRMHLEEKEAGKWNVVIGKDFASHVTHKSRRYGLFQVGEVNILLWQSGNNMS